MTVAGVDRRAARTAAQLRFVGRGRIIGLGTFASLRASPAFASFLPHFAVRCRETV